MDHAASLRNTIVAWIGLDWADQKHDICLQARGSAAIKHLWWSTNRKLCTRR